MRSLFHPPREVSHALASRASGSPPGSTAVVLESPHEQRVEGAGRITPVAIRPCCYIDRHYELVRGMSGRFTSLRKSPSDC